MNSGVVEDKYKINDFKAIVHFKKRKADATVPQLLTKLKERYNEVKGRETLTLTQYLTDRGLDKDEESRAIISRRTTLSLSLREEI